MTHNSNFSEDTGYVNIHGKDIKVFICEKTGRILVPIDEVKDMGFSLYRKSQYSRFLIDDHQFSKEFDVFMLQAAQNYMLEKKIAFKENEIIESINKCKQMLSSKSGAPTFNNAPQNPNPVQTNNLHKNEPEQNFINTRKFESFNDDIKVSTQLREPSALTIQNLQSEQRINKNFSQNKNSSFVDRRKSDNPRFSGRENGVRNFSEKKHSPNASFSEKKHSPNASFESVERKSFDGRKKNGFQDGRRENEPDEEKMVLAKLPQIEFTKEIHNIVITHVEKPNFAWVQDLDNADLLVKIDKKVREEAAKASICTKYVFNQIYLAQFDGCWYRCKIIKFKPLTVFFIDYGNTAEVTELKETSEELGQIPCQAARITFNDCKVTLEQTCKIRVRDKFRNGTVSVDLIFDDSDESDAAPPPPTAPVAQAPKVFKTKPPSIYKLVDGQKVMVIGHKDGKLALRTRESYDKFKQIESSLREVKTSPLSKVEKGQLVLFEKDGHHQRAVVSSVQPGAVDLELLDSWENISVNISPIKNITEFLASEPITYIITPQVKGFVIPGSEEVLQELVSKQVKAVVALEADGTFDLKLPDGLLSSKFGSDRPMLDQFTWYKPDLGKGSYMLNFYKDTNYLNFSDAETFSENLDAVIKAELEDNNPYEPVLGEVCFGLCQDNWSRCVVLRSEGYKYEVQFIDFGNVESLKADGLRKLTDDVKEVPILGIPCKLTGLPNVKNREELVKQTVIEGDTYDINFIRFKEDVYEIEIDAVNEALRA